MKRIKQLTRLSLCLLIGFLTACDQGGLSFGGLPANIVSFNAEPSSIEAGESTVLNWLILGGPGYIPVTLTPGDIELERSGRYQVTPSETTTYTLSAGREGKTVSTKEVMVRVEGAVAACKASDVITFKDAGFEATIKAALELEDAENVTCEQMGSITELWVSNGNFEFGAPYGVIEDISEIRYAVGLESLTLSFFESDIAALTSLPKLEHLSLFILDTGLSVTGWPDDLSPFGELKALKTLRVVGNEPTDEVVTQLNKLPKFDTLYLDNYDTGSSYLKPLKNLSNLRVLDLEGDVYLDDIRDLQALKQLTHLTLKNPNLPYTPALSADMVAGLTNLESLSIALGDPDVSAFANLVNLVELKLDDSRSYVQVTDISALEKLTKLQTLELKNQAIQDISPLLELPWAGGSDLVDLTGNIAIPADQIEILEEKVETVRY